MKFSTHCLFLFHTEFRGIPVTGHFVSTLSKSTVFSKNAVCLHANPRFFSLRFCSLKVDIFESFVSSKVNMTIKDLWCKNQQPQIQSFHLFHSDGTIKPMTLGQDAPGQMHRSSLLPYTPRRINRPHGGTPHAHSAS